MTPPFLRNPISKHTIVVLFFDSPEWVEVPSKVHKGFSLFIVLAAETMDVICPDSNCDSLSLGLQGVSLTHNLNGKWSLYYHLPQNTKWDLSSYTVVLSNIDSVEKAIVLNEKIGENVVKNCMMFLMRDGITPMWEDKRNRSGGCFSYKVLNKHVSEVWKNLFYLACGETLTTNREHHMHINGITVSPKKNFCIIKVWLDTIDHQDPNFIVDIPNLVKQGCLFKKHEPEF